MKIVVAEAAVDAHAMSAYISVRLSVELSCDLFCSSLRRLMLMIDDPACERLISFDGVYRSAVHMTFTDWFDQ